MCQDSIDWPFNYKAMLQFAIADAANLDFGRLDSHPCAADPYFVPQGAGAGACGRQRPLCMQVCQDRACAPAGVSGALQAFHRGTCSGPRVVFAGNGRRCRRGNGRHKTHVSLRDTCFSERGALLAEETHARAPSACVSTPVRL